MVSLILGFLAKPVVAKIIDPLIEPLIGRPESGLSIVVALLLATVFQMVAGELIPKNIAIAHPETSAQALSPLAHVVHGILSPIILVFNGAANWMVRRLGIEPQEEMATHHSLDELEYLIRSSGDSGALDPAAGELLRRTLRFGGRTAADALTPRLNIQALPTSATVADLAEEASSSSHSAYPVFEGDLDHVRGVVSIIRIFETDVGDRSRLRLSAIMEEPLVVPETRDLVHILEDLRTAEIQMAVVIDEHGGTAGILTLEDVLEEIVGDVDDEHDEAQDLTLGVEEGVYVIGGRLHVDEVADASGLIVPDGDYETVAGFVLDQLGRIPEPGDGFDYNGWRIDVVEMDDLRIASLQLTKVDR